MQDTLSILIANHHLSQCTMYNLPSCYGEASPQQIYTLRQFEKLHNQYLKSKRKRDFVIKRVYQMSTFVLYAHGDLCIMAEI